MRLGTEQEAVLDLGELRGQKVVCLTLDLEQDHADLLDVPHYEGVIHVPDLAQFLSAREMPLTCFVQGSLLQSHPAEIGCLSTVDVEFELHSYSHPVPGKVKLEKEVCEGKKAYRQYFGRDPVGYRAPLGVMEESGYGILASNGFRFDASVFPSMRPGVFNNLGKPTVPYLIGRHRLVEFPAGVLSNRIRVPMSLSYIKLLGEPFLRLIKAVRLPNLLVFGFHMHDLFPLASSREIPFHRYTIAHRVAFRRAYLGGEDGLSIFAEVVRTLGEKGFRFLKLADVYETICRNNPHL